MNPDRDRVRALIGGNRPTEIPETVTCSFCGEDHATDELESETWLQWQCLACANWNDKPEGAEYID